MKPQAEYRYSNNLLDISNINKKIFFHQSSFCYNKKLDFILHKNKKIFIGLKHEFISKESKITKDDVVMAGSIVIDISGYVVYLDNQSGTYRFDEDKLKHSLNSLNELIDIKHCSIFFVENDKSKKVVNNKYFIDNSKPYVNNKLYLDYLTNKDTSIRDNWILQENNFNADKYIDFNKDLLMNNHIRTNTDMATLHFLKFGQYEAGRILDYA